MRSIAVLSCLGAFASLAAQPLPDLSVLVGETRAYAVGPAQTASRATALAPYWSPDGRYVATFRTEATVPLPQLFDPNPPREAPFRNFLTVYDTRAERVAREWSLPNELSHPTVYWLAGSSQLLAIVGPERDLYRFDLNSGASGKLLDSAYSLNPSPTLPMAIVLRGFIARTPARPHGTLQFTVHLVTLTDIGEIPLAQLAAEHLQSGHLPEWTANGRHTVLRLNGAMLMDPLTGQTTELRETPQTYSPPSPPLVVLTSKSDEGSQAYLSIPGEPPSSKPLLLAGDATQTEVSPAGTHVAYVHKGLLLVRPISEIPHAHAKALLRNQEITALVQQAKQVGLALILCATDRSDVFPSQREDFAQAVMPYLRNSRLLDGFVYTFGGGSSRDIERPAQTELGFIPGPGGRAVAFADGSVRWIPD